MDNAGKTINRATGALKEFAIFGAGLFAGLIATAPNLSGTFAEIGVTTREWAMELGEHAQPFLEALNKGAQDLLVSWTSLDEGTQTWITNLALLVGSTLGMKGLLAICGIGGPLGLGIALIGAGILAWQTNAFGCRDAINSVAQAAKSALDVLLQWPTDLFGGTQPATKTTNPYTSGAGGPAPTTAEGLFDLTNDTIHIPGIGDITIPHGWQGPAGSSAGVPYSGTATGIYNAPTINVNIWNKTGENMTVDLTNFQ